ncbi:uncharacterized protein LOC143027495 isoform X2 [Oratosquilla oratoria]|uniref:uncharacterized protein LOC143027495 isoform X2 n=1 Tax=Oratosquilla oratoria TaxID=337810 RepID=UPI003F770BC9
MASFSWVVLALMVTIATGSEGLTCGPHNETEMVSLPLTTWPPTRSNDTEHTPTHPITMGNGSEGLTSGPHNETEMVFLPLTTCPPTRSNDTEHTPTHATKDLENTDAPLVDLKEAPVHLTHEEVNKNHAMNLEDRFLFGDKDKDKDDGKDDCKGDKGSSSSSSSGSDDS